MAARGGLWATLQTTVKEQKELTMDFIEWCDLVLHKVIEATLASSDARSIGVDQYQIARTIFGQAAMQPEFHGSKRHEAMHDALRSLQSVFLIESPSKSLWKATKRGKDLVSENDMTLLWQEICQENLDQEHQQLLYAVNKLSSRDGGDHIWLEDITHEAILAELGWSEGFDLLWPVSRELEELNLISCRPYLGRKLQCHATYRGLVWETRRGFTLESRFIDDLVAEWETTSVDFKQYFYVKSVEQKAEFIKDVLSLANTQASGRRWLIIGFDNKTHDYFGPPEANIRQDDLERLVAEYTDPCVELRYEVVNYRKGPVGKLEILRDRKKVPYRVAKSLGDRLKGDKKQIFQGQIFVRHGSQVQEPTDLELQALQEEGDRARSS